MTDIGVEPVRVEQGAEGDFAAFYLRWHRPLVRYVNHRFGPVDADEIAQETFTRALALFRSVNARPDPWPWLSRVARNVACDLYRDRRRYTGEQEAALDNVAEIAAGPEELAVDRAVSVKLARGLRRLPSADRQLLAMRIDTLSITDIAALMHASENTVRVRLHRARQHLLLMCGFSEGPRAIGVFTLLALLRRLRRLANPSGVAMGSLAMATAVSAVVLGGPEVIPGTAGQVRADTARLHARSVADVLDRPPHAVPTRPAVAPASSVRATAPATAAPAWAPAAASVHVAVAQDPRAAGRTNEEAVTLGTPIGGVVVANHGDTSSDASAACSMLPTGCPQPVGTHV